MEQGRTTGVPRHLKSSLSCRAAKRADLFYLWRSENPFGHGNWSKKPKRICPPRGRLLVSCRTVQIARREWRRHARDDPARTSPTTLLRADPRTGAGHDRHARRGIAYCHRDASQSQEAKDSVRTGDGRWSGGSDGSSAARIAFEQRRRTGKAVVLAREQDELSRARNVHRAAQSLRGGPPDR